MMSEAAEELIIGPNREVKLFGEGRIPASSKKRHSMAVLPVILEGEEESHLEDSAESEGADTPVSRDAQEEKVGGDRSPPEGSCSADVPAELSDIARGSPPPSLPISASNDFTSPSQAALLLKGGGDAIGGGPGSSDDSADALNVSAVTALAVGADPSPRRPEEINTDIKHQIMKEIRQFGRKYERIFRLLEEVRGPLEVRKKFVEFAIKEAARFKKRDLIKHLEKILESIVSDHLPKTGEQTPNM